MPLRAPPPGQSSARRAIENAFKDLERTIAPADSRDFSSTTIDDVRKAAIDIERQLAARQSLRNTRRLEPLFRGLEHYAKVIEVLANGTDYLPWIWAPIKLILKIAADYIEAFERIISAYSRIADSLRRFQVLERSFQGTPELYPTFVVFYANILTFHKAAYKFVSRPCWKLLFLTTWGRFQRQFDGILDDLKWNGDLIDKEANAHNIVEARNMRQQLDLWKERSLAQLAQSQREQAARQVQGLTTWLHLDDTDQLAMLDSLTEVGTSHPGTVDWVLKNRQLAAWLRPKAESRFIWLHGGPGMGKSVILAQLVSFLCSSNTSLVVHHFCSFTHGSSTQHDQIIKSLLLQLARSDSDLVNYIYEEYVGSKPATISLLEKLLELAVQALSSGCDSQGYGAVHILVDGLEECAVDKQGRLVRMLERLMSAGQSCKVLISSRDSPNSHVKKKRPSVISMAEEKPNLAEAIKRFAGIELDKMQQKLCELGISDGQKWEISSGISARADGMFLWARLVLNYLGANVFYDSEEFIAAAGTLPRELSEFYEKLVSRMVSGLDSFSVFRLKLIFGWIAFAKRPLRKAELQSALLFHQDNAIKATSISAPSYVIDLCKPLVDEHRDSTLGFIHVSVKEYLEGHVFDTSVQLNASQVLFENTAALLRCLREALQHFGDTSANMTRDVQVAHGVWGFLPYATEFWCIMLRDIAVVSEDAWDPTFINIAMTTSAMLQTLRSGPGDTDGPRPEPTDRALEPMNRFPSLWHDAVAGFQAQIAGRSRATSLDSVYLPQCPLRHIHDIFPHYEHTVQRLVVTYDHAELTRKELDDFRESFGHQAYICRFSSCSHSWTGLTNAQARLSHEATHAMIFPCPELGCQYPPFGSRAALKRHYLEIHDKSRPKPKLGRSASTNARGSTSSRSLSSRYGIPAWDDASTEHPRTWGPTPIAELHREAQQGWVTARQDAGRGAGLSRQSRDEGQTAAQRQARPRQHLGSLAPQQAQQLHMQRRRLEALEQQQATRKALIDQQRAAQAEFHAQKIRIHQNGRQVLREPAGEQLALYQEQVETQQMVEAAAQSEELARSTGSADAPQRKTSSIMTLLDEPQVPPTPTYPPPQRFLPIYEQPYFGQGGHGLAEGQTQNPAQLQSTPADPSIFRAPYDADIARIFQDTWSPLRESDTLDFPRDGDPRWSAVEPQPVHSADSEKNDNFGMDPFARASPDRKFPVTPAVEDQFGDWPI
ncbi:hypothetical protein QBC34DRAFT_419535 [Podospora aff. communis PSN243]|uniref:NACHT domain-containing protein n=1 Tax=Podospora aff. communis PSN243 TaxID=3040156 RepID=A0AAV9G2H2_9PEZI|nr:hypothetical protein QBC34DRAFT_419535 [Podospora aff. communis PSN243]